MGLVRTSCALTLCLALGLAACVKRAPLPDPAPERVRQFSGNYKRGEVLNAKGQTVDPAGLTAALESADYVLLGETHASACDQAFEAWIIELLAKSGRGPAVGLEMVPARNQAVLEKFSRGKIRLDKLSAALDWKSNWGFDFNLYSPIFAAAKTYGLPLYGLNAPKELVRKVSLEGFSNLSDAERFELPAALIPPKPEQEAFLREQYAAHAKMREQMHKDAKPGEAQSQDPEKGLRVFFSVQSLWDTQMAWQAFKAHRQSGRSVLILAGAGHVENGWGIAYRLSAHDPQARIVLIAAWRGGEDPEPGEADYFFYCPPSFKSSLGMVMELTDSKVVITEVQEGSVADKAGVKPGDVVLKAGDIEAKSLGDLHQAAMAAVQNHTPLSLTLDRKGQTGEVGLELPKKE